MKITRRSPHSGIETTMDLPITPGEYGAWLGGMSIQDAMPHLRQSDREFILTGYTEADWKEMFPENCGTCRFLLISGGDELICNCTKSINYAKGVDDSDACSQWAAQ